MTILEDQPTGKYLEALDDAALPQMSDALLTMVQFETALKAFKSRFYQRVGYDDWYWITEELLEEWNEDDKEEKDEDVEQAAKRNDIRNFGARTCHRSSSWYPEASMPCIAPSPAKSKRLAALRSAKRKISLPLPQWGEGSSVQTGCAISPCIRLPANKSGKGWRGRPG